MSVKYTSPDQYYGKYQKSPKDIPDIRKWILPMFGLLLVMELVIAVAAFRFWRQQNRLNEDQRTLFRANEIISESRQDSLQLGRLVNLAISTPTNENIKSFETLVQKKSAPVLDAPATPDTILNTLADVTPSHLKLRVASIAFGENEWLRFDRVSEEFEKLRSIDEKALAALKTDSQGPDGSNLSKTDAARGILVDNSYEARRIRLNDDISAMQSALDSRILTLLNTDASDGRSFFLVAVVVFILLLPVTIFLGAYLRDHEIRTHRFHKNQVRRLNDELTALRSELSLNQKPGPSSDNHLQGL